MSQAPQQPISLGGARDPQHMTLEEHRQRQQAVRQWQDQQASEIKRLERRATIKGVVMTLVGSAVIMGFLWLQVAAGRIDPPALIALPGSFCVMLLILVIALPAHPNAAKALRLHKKSRRVERTKG